MTSAIGVALRSLPEAPGPLAVMGRVDGAIYASRPL